MENRHRRKADNKRVRHRSILENKAYSNELWGHWENIARREEEATQEEEVEEEEEEDGKKKKTEWEEEDKAN